MARQGGPQTAVQHPEPALQPVGELIQRQGAQSYCCQLDRQRDSVQAPAHPDHVVSVASGDDETGDSGGGPLGEELNRTAIANGGLRDGGGSGVGHRKRRDGAGMLAWYIQRLPARGQHRHVRGVPQHCVGQHRACVQQMLAGIQDQQQFTVEQVVKDRVQLGRRILR